MSSIVCSRLTVRVLLNRRGVEDGAVVAAHVEVPAEQGRAGYVHVRAGARGARGGQRLPLVVLGYLQHLVVVLQLQGVCLLAFKEADANFLADDGCADKILGVHRRKHASG
jgi:hypothetical protein